LPCIALGGRFSQYGQCIARRRIAYDDDSIALSIAATRGEARVVEDFVERGVGQWFTGVLTRRKGRAHYIV